MTARPGSSLLSSDQDSLPFDFPGCFTPLPSRGAPRLDRWTSSTAVILIRQLNLPVKIVVFNNGSLGFVELEMKATGFLNHGTDLVNPDLAGIAKVAGVHGIHVDDPEQIRPALEEAFAHDGPALVDVAVNRQELAMPPSLKLDQIVDFNLYLIRAILNAEESRLSTSLEQTCFDDSGKFRKLAVFEGLRSLH